MKKFVNDFKKFIMRGNVIDLAVAVIIGGAFGRIIQSLVRDILMPVISLVIGRDGFENYKYVITAADAEAGIAENAIYYGIFIQNVIDFLIIAFVIFLIIRVINKSSELAHSKRLEAERLEKERLEQERLEKEALEKDKPTVESLLTDIKTLLAKQAK